MALWQKYHCPRSVEDALALLGQYAGNARVVAGGTDLLLEMQQGRTAPVEAMVDVTSIPDLCRVRRVGGSIEIGAAVTHSEIVRSEMITEQATCLVESCGVIGGPQVRNVATLGGNVAHALPAADGTTALVALNAEVEVATPDGRRWQPLLGLFRGPGTSAVDRSRELITRFRFSAGEPGSASAFKRIMRPQGVALPILACAVWVGIGGWPAEGNVLQAVLEEVRICIGPVGPVPVRARKAEATLRGRSLREGLADCVEAARAEFTPRTSKHRATSHYRLEMIEVLLRRALPLAAKRAVTGEIAPEGIGLH